MLFNNFHKTLVKGLKCFESPVQCQRDRNNILLKMIAHDLAQVHEIAKAYELVQDTEKIKIYTI